MRSVFFSRDGIGKLVPDTDPTFVRSSACIGGRDLTDWDAAQALASAAGPAYMAVDSGPSISPRYSIIRTPKIGDAVSYAYNGDSYPCGHIVAITGSCRVITTTDAGKSTKFYRRGQSGVWLKAGGTFCLVDGHDTSTNWER